MAVPVEGLSIGLGGKYVARQSLRQTYTPVDIADDDFEDRIEDDLQDGLGFSLDAGALYQIQSITVCDTRVGVAILNLPEMSMGDAEDIPLEVNVGCSAEKYFGKTRVTGALDYRDLLMSIDEDDDIGKRIHMGVEVQFPFLGLRAGLNQGYPALGATIDLKLLRLDAAMYSEEVGTYTGQQEDQRYVAQISFGW
jgi:hypothetical protein